MRCLPTPEGPSAELAERLSILRGHRRFIGSSLMSNGHQVQDDLLVIRGSVRTTTGIRVALIGPAGEILGGVLVVVSPSPQRNEGLVVDEDLLDTCDSLLLHRHIRGGGILLQ